MVNIRKLTEEYVSAFNARDLDKVAKYLAEDFKLTDPDVTKLTPKGAVIKYINRLFTSNETLSFEALDIFVDGDTSVIHFCLTLDTLVLDGVDIVTWKNQRMTNMAAYLTPRHQ
ncbi:nuclear transport factor 2 family protein [Planktomarina temperata]|nr:nuclear transport factor 2 family protein [Planktomarina temperata]